MELNKDCVRDVLLSCEKHLKLEDNGQMNELTSSDMKKILSNYELEDIKYTVLKLSEADFLNATIVAPDGFLVMDFYIFDISYEGHEFLNSIRDDNNWGKVKVIAKKIGSSSLSILQQIAISVITNQIESIFKERNK